MRAMAYISHFWPSFVQALLVCFWFFVLGIHFHFPSMPWSSRAPFHSSPSLFLAFINFAQAKPLGQVDIYPATELPFIFFLTMVVVGAGGGGGEMMLQSEWIREKKVQERDWVASLWPEMEVASTVGGERMAFGDGREWSLQIDLGPFRKYGFTDLGIARHFLGRILKWLRGCGWDQDFNPLSLPAQLVSN